MPIKSSFGVIKWVINPEYSVTENIVLVADFWLSYGILPTFFIMIIVNNHYPIFQHLFFDSVTQNREEQIRGKVLVGPSTLASKFKKDGRFIISRLSEKRYLRMPVGHENRGCVVIGTQGSGKTQIFYLLLIQIYTDYNDSAIIYDVKPEFFLRFYSENRGDKFFYPGREGSLKWNILSEIEDEFDLDFFVKILCETRADSVNSNIRTLLGTS